MCRSLRTVLRALAVSALACSLILVGPIAQASDPTDEFVPPSVVGACVFQGATVEGAASSVFGVSTQTGIFCSVYDQFGTYHGGCGVVLPAPSSACAGPTSVLLGPPIVCTDAFAVFGSRTATYHDCS